MAKPISHTRPVQCWTLAQIADKFGLKVSRIISVLKTNGIAEAYFAGQTRLFTEDQLPAIEKVVRQLLAKKPQVIPATAT